MLIFLKSTKKKAFKNDILMITYKPKNQIA